MTKWSYKNNTFWHSFTANQLACCQAKLPPISCGMLHTRSLQRQWWQLWKTAIRR